MGGGDGVGGVVGLEGLGGEGGVEGPEVGDYNRWGMYLWVRIGRGI